MPGTVAYIPASSVNRLALAGQQVYTQSDQPACISNISAEQSRRPE